MFVQGLVSLFKVWCVCSRFGKFVQGLVSLFKVWYPPPPLYTRLFYHAVATFAAAESSWRGRCTLHGCHCLCWRSRALRRRRVTTLPRGIGLRRRVGMGGLGLGENLGYEALAARLLLRWAFRFDIIAGCSDQIEPAACAWHEHIVQISARCFCPDQTNRAQSPASSWLCRLSLCCPSTNCKKDCRTPSSTRRS